MSRTSIPLVLLLSPVAFLIAGCSGPYTSSVAGTVTLDGKPLPKGHVTFQPVAGGPMAYGHLDPSGNYTIRTAGSEGMIPGDCTVIVVAYTREPWEGMTHQQVEQIRLVPARYNNSQTSGLRFTIEQGENRCDLNLKSG